MRGKYKKIIAPVIIAALMVVWYIFIICVILFAEPVEYDIPLLYKIIATVIPASIAGVAIYVLIERINEIKGGEEDDLSKY